MSLLEVKYPYIFTPKSGISTTFSQKQPKFTNLIYSFSTVLIFSMSFNPIFIFFTTHYCIYLLTL